MIGRFCYTMAGMRSPDGQHPRSSFLFGDFELDLTQRRLSRGLIRVKLQPQPLHVLELLLERAPSIVSRDELRREVWGEHVNVDVEHGLNYCIRQIRAALLDGSAAPRFVETIPRQGYRFIAAVRREEVKPVASETLNEPLQTLKQVPDAARPSWFGAQKWLFAGYCLLAAAVLFLAGARWAVRQKTETRPPTMSYVTTYPGDERDPSFSPDGNEVAFSWGGNKDDNKDIYVLPIGSQSPLRLTQDPAPDVSPAWSPDGRSIAFIRRVGVESASIILIPALGGPERLLCKIRVAVHVTGFDRGKLAWAPDGKWLVFTNQVSSGEHALFLFSLETGRVRQVFPQHASGSQENAGVFSSDGRWLAFTRFNGSSAGMLLVQRMNPALEPVGDPILVPNSGPFPLTPAWDPDGKRLLFIDKSAIKQFRIGGATDTIYEGDASLYGLSVNGSRMIAGHDPEIVDILTIPLRPGGVSPAGPEVPVIRSRSENHMPRFSPDGKHLAFVSNRGGASELWLADANGENQKQLTTLGSRFLGWPRWSPDSKQIAFHAQIANQEQIFALDVNGGIARQITADRPGSGMPSWSNDGNAIYFTKLIPGQPLLYQVSAAGGKETLLSQGEGEFTVAVPGRDLLLYSKANKLGIFARTVQQDLASDVEEQIVGDYLPPFGGFYPVEDGVYYTSFTSAGMARSFRFYSFATRKSTDIAPVLTKIGEGLSVSPDRRRLAYCAEQAGNGDLIMLERK